MRHQHISWVKSGFRFVGYGLLPFSLPWAMMVLVFSEVLGVVEEVGHE